ncbi:MAG: gliding motility lipoprotein GldH [Bacteroidales bacterium]|nr:gliding motility lipoprotein GldH [Bacteroidales bacterium]
MNKFIFYITSLTIIFSCIFLTSCSDTIVFVENKTLTNRAWNRNNILTFRTTVNDTSTIHNIFITLRIDGNYSKRNLYIFSTIKDPLNNEIKDTINLILADEKGRWYGKSNLGDLYYYCFLYKKNVRFPKPGQYTFTLEQAMRSPIIENIEDVGIKIEKVMP